MGLNDDDDSVDRRKRHLSVGRGVASKRTSATKGDPWTRFPAVGKSAKNRVETLSERRGEERRGGSSGSSVEVEDGSCE